MLLPVTIFPSHCEGLPRYTVIRCLWTSNRERLLSFFRTLVVLVTCHFCFLLFICPLSNHTHGYIASLLASKYCKMWYKASLHNAICVHWISPSRWSVVELCMQMIRSCKSDRECYIKPRRHNNPMTQSPAPTKLEFALEFIPTDERKRKLSATLQRGR